MNYDKFVGIKPASLLTLVSKELCDFMIKTCLPKEEKGGPGIIRICSAEKIKSSYSGYLTDESHYELGRCEEIFFPFTEEQVCNIIKEKSNKKTPVTISGARTGIVAGAVPLGGIVLNVERMNLFLDIIHDKDNGWSIWIQPGVRLSDFHLQVENKNIPLQNDKIAAFLADHHNYFYPPDPTEESAFIGSTVATNASGARSLFYGTTRDFVQGLRIALTNGEILELERGRSPISPEGLFHLFDSSGKRTSFAPPAYITPTGKSTCGLYSRPCMDLIDLFIGSEGILGVITAVKIKLVKRPAAILSGLSFFSDESQAINFSLEARQHLMPLSLEYFDSNSLDILRLQSEKDLQFNISEKSKSAVFWETAYDEKGLETIYHSWEKALVSHGASMEDTWAGMEWEEWGRLKRFRHAVPELSNSIIARRKAKIPELHKVSTDMTVPDSHLLNIIKEYQNSLQGTRLEYLIFGHIGNNHLHVNILPRNNQELSMAKDIVKYLALKVISFGGVVAAEHGIGKLKYDLVKLQFGEEGLNEMLRVKKALDPGLILGRGNIIPESLLPQTV